MQKRTDLCKKEECLMNVTAFVSAGIVCVSMATNVLQATSNKDSQSAYTFSVF